MIPMYFGPSERPLFGLYHPPEGNQTASHAVLLCYPVGQEYERSHRHFRQLAALLSKAGLAVLRFDYVGTGDSAGETGEGTPQRWRENIKTAATELRDLASVGQISAVGLRLGAALAACVGALHQDFDTLVLWDPVVDGTAYLSGLRAMHADALRNDHPGGSWVSEEDRAGEALGIPLSNGMRAELEQIDLLALPRYSARRVVVAVSDERESYTALCRRLGQLGQEYAYFHVPGASWDEASPGGMALSGSSILERITTVLGAAHD